MRIQEVEILRFCKLTGKMIKENRKRVGLSFDDLWTRLNKAGYTISKAQLRSLEAGTSTYRDVWISREKSDRARRLIAEAVNVDLVVGHRRSPNHKPMADAIAKDQLDLAPSVYVTHAPRSGRMRTQPTNPEIRVSEIWDRLFRIEEKVDHLLRNLGESEMVDAINRTA